MNWEDLARQLTLKTPTKIVLLVLDGLGDLPTQGQTPLEEAHTPHLDALARESVCGVTDPVLMGITPGSGPAHLSLFGYDPTKYLLGRGILEALGIGVDVGPHDLVARGNFATLREGLIVDRRAGRIPTEENRRLCEQLNQAWQKKTHPQVTLYPGKEHRFVVKFTAPELSDALSDADPQKENKPLTYTRALAPEAEETARLVNQFIDEVTELLKDEPKANTVLLRGFARHPTLPTMTELYQLHPAAIAHYPMYKGLAKLVGMEILEVGPKTEDIFHVLEENYHHYDFFYLHFKKTDSAGEDGHREAKIRAIEELDTFIPRLLQLKPEVLVVTSDHSTPCALKGHSWHPNPLLLHAATARIDQVERFSELACQAGHLGRFPALSVMPLMLAHAGKLKKFGA
ncbi:MAG: phosphoglycerate mutase [Candidatus Aminicenantes bacterium 4484_214]|nr:MAG: phosphoglycerate mutase [Candidatus Aminicenantes bacterium 4484_214]